ncbi:MAG: ABC transporter substrate-binding protein, partial [Alphaproteobacteria bacterium]|nr:ABC transporter substrate-binding protein [Alphaproteobacteria bacterium]
ALLPVLADARDRRTLRGAVRLIDRRLRDGLYVIPLYYLDEDWIAYYDYLARPKTVPVSGVRIDTFWHTQAR